MKTCFIEKEHGWIIRICSDWGFRWFETKDKSNKVLKAIEAKKIEQSIIDGDKRYHFVKPIYI